MLAEVPYLLVLLCSLIGLALVDVKFKLLLWRNFKAGVICLLLGVTLFLAWDLVGIQLGIFFRGGAENLTGLALAPELPVEEPVFLLLLCYSTLLCYTGFKRILVTGKRG